MAVNVSVAIRRFIVVNPSLSTALDKKTALIAYTF